MATTSADRIITLDIIRGIAVMGIFSVNIVGMAMLEAAYFYPPQVPAAFDEAYDRIMWAANFILVDGKFRAMFSILFGASLVLVCERALVSGTPAWRVHYPRMIVLLAFGLAHYYLLWWGDILANYALVGMIAFAFWRLPANRLLPLALIGFAMAYGPMLYFGGQEVARMQAKEGPDATAEQRAFMEGMRRDLVATPEQIADSKAAHASIPAHLDQVLEEGPLRPFSSVPGYGIETLALMLLGMAAYKSGYLTGTWRRRSQATVAVICVAASLIYFGASAWAILRSGFEPFLYFPLNSLYAGALHPVAAIGYIGLIVLLFPRRGAVAERFAAVGRAAFTNYLGATLIGTALFYGFGLGLYGELSRGEVWLFVPLVWAFMLAWSKWWLDHYRYGPFEWAWRCLARWRWEPMRQGEPAGALPA